MDRRVLFVVVVLGRLFFGDGDVDGCWLGWRFWFGMGFLVEGGLSGRRSAFLGLGVDWRLALICSFLFVHELIIYFILSIKKQYNDGVISTFYEKVN